jgi:Helix-turn-helix domain
MSINLTRGPITIVNAVWPEDDDFPPEQPDALLRAERSRDCADSLLDVNGAAEILGISAKWVYVNYKTLPHVQIGNGERPRLRFRRKALLDWIDRREIDWRRQ